MTASGIEMTVSTRTIGGVLLTAALGLVMGGFGLGVLLSHPGSATKGAPAQAQTKTTGNPGTTPSTVAATTSTSPFITGSKWNFQTPVEALTGKTTTLARGTKGTVVLAMASWCLYCAYEDKYVVPELAKTPGVVVDVVDVSPQGGIGVPGPQAPAFSGHDGSGGPLTVAGMAQTMRQYVKTFGTLSAPNIHVYVAPVTTQSLWAVTNFPSMAFMSTQGTVSVAPLGAQTLSQAQVDLTQAVGG